MINLIYNTSIGRNKKLVFKKLLKTTVVSKCVLGNI